MSSRVWVLLFLLIGSASAQLDVESRNLNQVRVHVNFVNGESCEVSTKVALVSSFSAPVARGSADRSCVVNLTGVPAGTYHLVVSSREVTNVEAGEVTVGTPWNDSIEVTVRQPEAKTPDHTELSSVSTSVADLKIPKPAAKQFNKANQQMEKRDWSAAIATLRKAIAIHPQYAAAYNNLGVIYARLGDRKREAEALQEAIRIDDRYVPAYLNLARMRIATNALPEAEAERREAATIDPTKGVTLVLLAHAEYMDQHFDDAIAQCKRVHQMRDFPHAWAHWIAAFAYEKKNQIAEAGAEFRMFVSEEPTGIYADAARKELANIADFLARNR
jgi:TPR repeat